MQMFSVDGQSRSGVSDRSSYADSLRNAAPRHFAGVELLAGDLLHRVHVVHHAAKFVTECLRRSDKSAAGSSRF